MKDMLNVSKKKLFSVLIAVAIGVGGLAYGSTYIDSLAVYEAKNIPEKDNKEILTYLSEKDKEGIEVVIGRQEELFDFINSKRAEKDFEAADVNSKLQNVVYLTNINSYYADETGKKKFDGNGFSILKQEGFVNKHKLTLEQHTIHTLPKNYEELSGVLKEKILKSNVVKDKDIQTMAVSVMKKNNSNYYLSLVYSYH